MSFAASEPVRFYLGATSPQGFVSCQQQLCSTENYEYLYIVKSGPCKQAFICSIADKLAEFDDTIEYIHSPFDSACCDGVIFHTLRAAVIDGSEPYSLEPRYYDAFETILTLGDYCDKETIRAHKEEIRALIDAKTRLYERCVRFISAAGSLMDDTYSLALACTDEAKLTGFCERTLSREIKQGQPRGALEHSRFLSAITQNGIELFEQTIHHYCGNLYIIEDEFGAASNLILQKIKTGALSQGYDVISCWCPFSPFHKLEHVLIPELSLGFATSNRWHTLQSDKGRMIHGRRFTNLETLSVRKQRISFNKRASTELIEAAQNMLEQVGAITRKLERVYLQALDHEKLDRTAEQIAMHIRSLSSSSG